MNSVFFSILFVFSIIFGQAQDPNKSFIVRYIADIPQIDGILDEPVWKTVDGPHKFQQYFPSDSILAEQPTSIQMFTNGTTLYIGLKIYSTGNEWVIPSLERDFRAGGNDNISLMFDTFNDGTNAFLFGINPLGVRREALISGGGEDSENDFNTSWDVKWLGESKTFENYYTAELAIPLTSFKFREGETKWRFQSYRFDMQTNERSAWYRVPQNQSIFSLAFMGDMVFEKPLGKSRTPLALIPYINTVAEKDYIGNDGRTNFKIGGDVKLAIGNGMNLDVTINPDFSNVEVDAIITNLTRFEVSLPEKRQFFIDNSDLFGSFGGSRDANPFFSRRIGIARDSTGNFIENRILGGVRLSGKLNEEWRLGILSIQTDEDLDNQIASNNNTMIALQKKVFTRENIGMFFINKQAFKDYDFIERENEFNRVLGLDYNLASENNKWNGKFYAHKSFQPDDRKGNYSTGANLGYNTRNYNVFSDWVYINADFQSDLGFIRRTDIVKSATSISRIFYPKYGSINTHSFQFFPVITWQPSLDYQNTDRNINVSWAAEFQDQSEIGADFFGEYIFLSNPFDPTNTKGGIPLSGNQGYHFNSVALSYKSNRARTIAFEGLVQMGRFFNGDLFSFEGESTLRLQPKKLISLALNYNRIRLPNPYPSADFWLVSPKFNITFSKSVFWSTLFQYGNQINNLGVNSRLQWRFAPLSDLFIVYNDNYVVNQFEPRYRSLNLKFTYWLNL
ncbi:MAG TPA: hydrolase [Pricia antarctica]|uniref:Hydrolase n=2 Tax=root TaxID=1 RepID=A0A831QLG3_9FLAO|nr:hydrolase [Pricia antarctica]